MMRAIHVPGSDLKRYFRGWVPRLALLVIILMPLLYGALYLWAFWNPFDAVNKMPVAIVNLDKGAEVAGTETNVGAEVTQQIIESGQLDLHQVGEAEARDGLAHGRYYFTVTLPEDFSEAVASAQGDSPRRANLIFTYNDANNYLASIIGADAAQQVVSQVSAKIGEQTVGVVLTGLSTAGAGLIQAAEGAKQLDEGLVTANSGAQQLAIGANTLATNMVTAKDGAAKLAGGIDEVSTAVLQATDPLLQVADRVGDAGLPPGQVTAAATRLAGVLGTVSGALETMELGEPNSGHVITEVVRALRANPDPQVRGLADALAPFQAFLDAQAVNPQVATALRQARADAQLLSGQLGNPNSALRMGLGLVEQGGLVKAVTEVRGAVNELRGGADQLASGLVELNAGSQELAAGADQLAAGTPKLQDGAHELATALGDGAKQVPHWTPQQQKSLAATLADPVVLQENYNNEAKTFGTGFAPFFFSLALFVGGIITWMLITPLLSRPVLGGVNALRTVLVSLRPAVIIGVLQASILFAVVHFGIGLNAYHPIGTWLFLFLVTTCFMAMIQALNAMFGPAIGRVLTLAFLMFQLVAAGGVYPVPTTATPFHYLHWIDPMTYTVNGLRQTTVGGVDYRLWVAVAVLLGLIAASVAASTWAARRNRQYTMERLYPPVVV